MLGALKAIKGYYDYGIFQAVQVAAIVALRHGEEGRQAQVVEYQERRDVLVRGLSRLGWEPETPKAGMFVWTPMPEPWRSQMGSIDFAMKLLEEANVVVSPGRGFGETGEGYLRLALVENAHRLRQAVRQIGRCLRAEPVGPLSAPRARPCRRSVSCPTWRSLPGVRCRDRRATVEEATHDGLRYCERPLICELASRPTSPEPGGLPGTLATGAAARLPRVRGRTGLPLVQDALRRTRGCERETRRG